MQELVFDLPHGQLCLLAALEYKVTCQLGIKNGQTGNGERWVASEHNPRRLRSADGESFVGVELGFGSAQGPSLQATLKTLEADNRKRQIIYHDSHNRGDDEILAAERSRRKRFKKAKI